MIDLFIFCYIALKFINKITYTIRIENVEINMVESKDDKDICLPEI